MAALGDPGRWANAFPDGLVPQIVRVILDVWKSFPKPAPKDHEVPITRRFRIALIQEKNIRSMPVLIERESTIDNLETGAELGRIDLRFTHGYREEVYFSLECKRLNVVSRGKFSSKAGEYVAEGMMRFVDARYSRNLRHAGMMGYVMNSNVRQAITAVTKQIGESAEDLKLQGSKGLSESPMFSTCKNVKATIHSLGAGSMTLHHIFLCC